MDDTFEAVVRDFGRLDIVVNNAGISRVGPHTQDVTDEDWHDSIAVMQTGVFYCMRAAAEDHARPRSPGSVVNISSIRGFSPNPGRMRLLRAQSRGADDDEGRSGRMGAARRACERDRARRAAHADVGLATPARGAVDEPRILETVPAHRLGLPSEVGKLVVFPSSDDAAYITGAVHTIDGALTAIPAG